MSGVRDGAEESVKCGRTVDERVFQYDFNTGNEGPVALKAKHRCRLVPRFDVDLITSKDGRLALILQAPGLMQ